MKPSLLATLFVTISLVAASRAFGYAEARAGGQVADDGSPGEFDSGAISADASKNNLSDEFQSDKYDAFALATPGKLRAFADVKLESALSSVSAKAEAVWADALTVDTPNLDNIGDAFLYFRPFAHGRHSIGGSADYYVAVSNPLTADIFADDLLSTESTAADTLQAQLAIPIYRFLAPVSFYMSLSVRANAATTPGEAFALYGDTAWLPPIFIGDANGNPLPALAGMHIVGESGRAYPVTVVQRTPGDYNGDGIVDAGDYVVWRDSLGQTGLTLNADGNGDQMVDQEDFKIWRELYGTQAASGEGSFANASVPEPSFLSMLYIAMSTMCLFRRVASVPIRARAVSIENPVTSTARR
jgi:hypothetical protein